MPPCTPASRHHGLTMNVSAHQLRALAVAAQRDARTVTRWLAGLPVVHPASIEAAAAELGIFRAPALAMTSLPATLAATSGGPVR